MGVGIPGVGILGVGIPGVGILGVGIPGGRYTILSWTYALLPLVLSPSGGQKRVA